MKITKCETCKKTKECLFDIPKGRLCRECYKKEQEKMNPAELDRNDLIRTLTITGGLVALEKLD